MVQKKPLISVITCTKNSSQFLENSLKSVSDQTFTRFEHIIVDAQSTDDTLSIISQYQNRLHSYKTRLLSQKAMGISAAMNLGVKHSRGDYIYFLHSDDTLFNNNVLEEVSKYLQKNVNLEWVYGQINVIDKFGNSLGIFPRYKLFQRPSYKLLSYYNYIPHQAVFIKRDVFTEYGYFDTNLSTVMDYDYWLRVANKTHWSYMPIKVANYRVHDDAQSSSRDNSKSNREEYLNVQNRNRNILGRVLLYFLNPLISIMNPNQR